MGLILTFLAVSLGLLAQTPHRCAACHAEPVADVQSHKHSTKGLDCDTCHGPSEKHRTSVGNAPPDRVAAPNEVSALCGGCHAPERKEYETSKHFLMYASANRVRTANCATCHGQHAVRTFAALSAACVRCHEQRPAACAATPPAATARVACMNCHARHTLSAARR